MSYLVHALADGHFEMIDAEFISLYPNADDFIPLSDEAYQEFISKRNHLTRFVDGQFVYQEIVFDAEKEKQKAIHLVWEQIKQKRYQNTHAGVYVPSVDKWFHTNEESRTQYLALQLLPQLPDGLQWKTMDNSFIAMTKELVTQITLAVLSKEQQDFANAEKHKQAMEASDNPLDYDYSTGWSDSYD